MHSPRMYKYRDSYVLYIPTVHTFGSVLLTHTLLVQTHIHDVSAPWLSVYLSLEYGAEAYSRGGAMGAEPLPSGKKIKFKPPLDKFLNTPLNYGVSCSPHG